MRVVTPKHIADQVQDWYVPEGKRDKKVSRSTALAVLDALWECNKRKQMHVYPRIEVIAENSGIRSRSTVANALTALEAQGLIRALGPRHGGRTRPTVWGLVDDPVDNGKPTTAERPVSRRETNRSATETDRSASLNQPLSDRNRPLSDRNRPLSDRNRPLSGCAIKKRTKEERKEERMKSEHPLRLVDPPEPPRACRMPGCDRPALVGSRCLRHASGLPFPLPTPADGVPERPERRQETA